MPLSSLWRHLNPWRRRHETFYDTQHVMRRAIESDAAGKPDVPVMLPAGEAEMPKDPAGTPK